MSAHVYEFPTRIPVHSIPLVALNGLPSAEQIRNLRHKVDTASLTTGDMFVLDNLLGILEQIAMNVARVDSESSGQVSDQSSDLPLAEHASVSSFPPDVRTLGNVERSENSGSVPAFATDEIGPRCTDCHLERGDSPEEELSGLCFGCLSLALYEGEPPEPDCL